MNAYFFASFFATLLQYSLQYRAVVVEYNPEKKTDDNVARYVSLIGKAAKVSIPIFLSGYAENDNEASIDLHIKCICYCECPKSVNVDNHRYALVDVEKRGADKEATGLLSILTYGITSDIIVFPENTLTIQWTSFQLVPDPKDRIIPYRNASYSKYKAVSSISEAAARNKTYVVVNLLERVDCVNGSEDCPDRGYFLYNTNIAFDRNGMVVARYRKFNLFVGFTDRPKTAELSTFTTDFGVTFGMFICFDILFKSPTIDLVQKKNVTNLIFSTKWFGELPFLTATQVQSGWSYAMDVNLLASGANNPTVGSTGSGIYMGRKSKVSYMLEMKGEVLIMRGINGSRSAESVSRVRESPIRPNGLKLKQDPTIPLSESKPLNMDAGKFREKICHGRFCCSFSAKYRKSEVVNDAANYTYRAVVFQGKRYFREDVLRDVNYCAILLCTAGNCAKKPVDGDYPLVFDYIEVGADFEEKDAMQMPSTLMWHESKVLFMYLHSMDYDMFEYERKAVPGTNMVNASLRLKAKDVGNVVTFGIWGRYFPK